MVTVLVALCIMFEDAGFMDPVFEDETPEERRAIILLYAIIDLITIIITIQVYKAMTGG